MLVCLNCGNTDRSKFEFDRDWNDRIDRKKCSCKNCYGLYSVTEIDNLLGDSLILLNLNGYKVYSGHVSTYFNFGSGIYPPAINGSIKFRIQKSYTL